MEPVKAYKKTFEYSYTLGAFPTFELLRHRGETVRAVYLTEGFPEEEKLRALCAPLGVPVLPGEKVIRRISPKENCYVAGVFDKFEDELLDTRPHVVLVHPGDMGNLGTIMRTVLGFGMRDLALIAPSADPFHPRTIRASMGALFQLRCRMFDSFEAYRALHPSHELFPFLLTGSRALTPADCPRAERYALIFGNEATGLDPSFAERGTGLFIPQTDAVDSLNLSIAVGIGVYLFTEANPPGEES